ncbi:MAG TPA: substrate-binding domain-containing protein [Verrucomicrobiae bacterium]|nr:substrate-binding domain-containing protein [Verrucomicrobiae bacterium]
MRTITKLLSVTAIAGSLAAMTAPAVAADMIGEGVTVYMQMGGQPGEPPVLPRTNGAKAAAAALGVNLIEQYSSWQAETMLAQFREALAAKPNCIVIMGHPGNDAFADLVADAVAQGIVVTSGNAPLKELQVKYQDKGFGYAGVDLYEGGAITARAMLGSGLASGDKALVFGNFSKGDRGLSDMGMADTLEKAGVTVDRLEMSEEVNGNPPLAIPQLVAYLQEHPDTKAIGTQHGGITPLLPDVAQQAGKAGGIILAGIDTDPKTVDAVKAGTMTATLDQQLYLQGFLPVLQCVLSAKYQMGGFTTNTAAGTLSPANVEKLIPLIDAGIR